MTYSLPPLFPLLPLWPLRMQLPRLMLLPELLLWLLLVLLPPPLLPLRQLTPSGARRARAAQNKF